MRRIVSNTTPLISLLKLGKLELLHNLYGEVLIPKAVFNEVEAGKQKSYYCDLSALGWIKTVNITETNAVRYFLDLDAGEAEAIILATETKADLIIIDEKLGRFYAKHANLKVTGTIGVLLKAKSAGLIKAVKPLLIELTEKEVWISEKLIGAIARIAGEY